MLHIIVNPDSGYGRGLKNWDRIRPLFEEAGVPYQLHIPSGARTIETICAELTSRSGSGKGAGKVRERDGGQTAGVTDPAADQGTGTGDGGEVRICILGGDGTMNAAVNGIRDFAHTRVGFVQAGSGNDLARGLGIPKDTEEVVRRIIRGEVLRCCDVGEVLFYNRFDELDPRTHLPRKEEKHIRETSSPGGTDSADPADPVDPVDPADPADSVDPTNPAEPSYPANSAYPAAGPDRKPDSRAGKGEQREGKRRVVARTRFNVSAGIGFDAAVCQEANASGFKQVLNRIRLGKLAYIGVACRQIMFCPAVKMQVRLWQEKGNGCAKPYDELKMQQKIRLRTRMETRWIPGPGSEQKPGKSAGHKAGEGSDQSAEPTPGEKRGLSAGLNPGKKGSQAGRIRTLYFKKALFAAFMNTPYEGGGFCFAPDADPEDGVLNMCAADNVRRVSFFRIFPHAYKGKHLRYDGVLADSGRGVEILTDRPLWVHTDGEVTCRSSHIRIRVRKGALRLMC